jgi:hypothetical protein
MFYPGQKVVCIDAKERPGFYWHREADRLVEGNIYTVTGYQHDFHAHGETYDLVFLQEARNKSTYRRNDTGGYRAVRFRPLVEKKTDISAFTKLLKTKELEVT